MFSRTIRNLKIPLFLFASGIFLYCDTKEMTFYLNNIYYQNTKYASKLFWEKEYKEDNSEYDWYVKYDEISPTLNKYLKAEDKILQIGAGNSTLAEELYKENFKSITNIDISEEVVKEMRSNYEKRGININYLQMDMMNLQFAENNFDAIIDKAGSDVVLVGKKPFKTYRKFMNEIEKVLKENGKFIFITLFSNFPINNVIDQTKWEILNFIIEEKYSILILRKK